MTAQISIVTPCLNAASVIRDCVSSTRCAMQSRIEHIVVDGGSTDGTLDILREFTHVRVISGEDSGPYDAVAKGFARTQGVIMAWLNADDFYLPGALEVILDTFNAFPTMQWVTTAYPTFADAHGRIVAATHETAYDRIRALHPERAPACDAVHTAMQQESTFWRRCLWDKCGSRLDSRFHYAADFELWLRFWQHTEVFAIDAPLGCFRWSQQQRSRRFNEQYRAEVNDILRAHGGYEIGRTRTLARRAALLCRGLPQNILRHLPYSSVQQTLAYSRERQSWRAATRYSIVP